MTHDPLCPWVRESWWDNSCVVCDLIVKVRKDQTQQCIAAVEEQVEGDPVGNGYNWNSALSRAVEAIEALRKK